MKYKFRAGTRLNDLTGWDVSLVLTKDTEIEVEGVDPLDVIAEKMASNRQHYALHRGELAHDEEGVRTIDGEQRKVRIHVTYGVNGEREESYGDAITVNDLQSRSVKAETVDSSSNANN